MTILHVYCDASFKMKKGVCSFVDSHSKIFYVSNFFHTASSVGAELYAIHFAMIEGIKIALANNYKKIIVNTDLLMATCINEGGKKKYSFMQYIHSIISMYSDELEIVVAFHGKCGLLRMVDTLAYRKIRGKNLVAEKKEVFGEFYSYPVIDYTIQLTNDL